MTFEKRVQSLKKRFQTAETQPPETHFAVQITLTGEDSGVLYIANTERGFEVAPYDYHDNTAALTISGENLVKLLSGTLRLERALADGRAAVEGDVAHVQLLQSIADAPQRRCRKG